MVYHGIILVDVMFKLRHRPLGAYRIANLLREAGYNILVIDMYSTMSIDKLKQILDRVISTETLFLGYSSTMFTANPTLSIGSMAHQNECEQGIPTSREFFIETNRYVKELNPNLKIIYGGAATVHIKPIIQSDPRDMGIDYIIEGYSEGMIVDIVNNIKDNTPQNIASAIKNTGIINYDPEASLFDFRNHLHDWHESDLIQPGEVLPLEVGRGCIFKCKFCTFPLIGKKKTDISYMRTEEALVTELASNYERYNVTNYVLVDDTFNERTDKIETLLRARDKAKVDARFSAYLRLDLVASMPEQIPLMKELNLSLQYYGIETLTEQSAKAIGKSGNSDKLVETLHRIHDEFGGKVNLAVGQMIGLPHETRDTVEISINRMLATPVDSILFMPIWLSTSAYGDSDFLKNPEAYGYQHLGNGRWKNEHWDSDECQKISDQYTYTHYESGRIKLNGTEIFGIMNAGYTFDELIGVPAKNFLLGELGNEVTVRHHAYRAKYHDALTKYLDI